MSNVMRTYNFHCNYGTRRSSPTFIDTFQQMLFFLYNDVPVELLLDIITSLVICTYFSVVCNISFLFEPILLRSIVNVRYKTNIYSTLISYVCEDTYVYF